MTWLSRLLSRDAAAALAILAFSVLTFSETFRIKAFLTPTVGPEFWPRIVSAALIALSSLYLVRSLVTASPRLGERRQLTDLLREHVNPVLILSAFLLFLIAVPVLGMPLGLLLFSFLSMALVGDRDARSLLLAAAVTIIFVGGMIFVFTYGLLVFFPEGQIVRLR